MIDSFAPGNILATVVVALSIVSLRWVAPKLTRSMLVVFLICCVLFLVGQYSQEGEWGPVVVQHHLQDFSYTPWATVFALGVLSLVATWLPKPLTQKTLVVASLVLATFSGFATEMWDTHHVWRLPQSFVSAIDFGDYSAFMGGAMLATMWFRARIFSSESTS